MYYRHKSADRVDVMFETAREVQVGLGDRLRGLRLSRGMDQLATAAKAGISEKALRNLEAGRGSTVETLLRVLKALDAVDALDVLAPEPEVNPMAMLKLGRMPQRARRKRQG